jgi:hypothetical protein
MAGETITSAYFTTRWGRRRRRLEVAPRFINPRESTKFTNGKRPRVATGGAPTEADAFFVPTSRRQPLHRGMAEQFAAPGRENL